MELQSKEEVLEILLSDVMQLLEDLCLSGFDTVHDSTLEALRKMVPLTLQYGMSRLSGMLNQLADGLELRRHRMEKQGDKLAQLYTSLNEYLYLAMQKTMYDQGRNQYLADV